MEDECRSAVEQVAAVAEDTGEHLEAAEALVVYREPTAAEALVVPREPTAAVLELRVAAPPSLPDPAAAVAAPSVLQLRLPRVAECAVLDKLLRLVREIKTPRKCVG